MLPHQEKLGCRLWLLAVAIFFSCTYLLAPIVDADFFWHLATGKWILEHQQLPTRDPFSFLARQVADARQLFTLQAYWLSQILYALLDSLFGLAGIVALRYLVVFAWFAILWQRREAAPLVHAQLLTLFFLFFFANYTLDRPQTFSFLFFSALLWLVARLREGGAIRVYGLLLATVMLLWGNMHGGVMVGQVYLLASLLDSGIRRWKKDSPSARENALAGVLLSALLLSLANPNAPIFFDMYLQLAGGGNKYDVVTSEYRSVLSAVAVRYSFAWYFLALLVAGLVFFRGFSRWEAAGSKVFFVLLAVMSFADIRYVPLFLVFSLPLMSRLLSGYSGKVVRLCGFVVIALFFLTKEVRRDLSAAYKLHDELVWDYYPAAAARFINETQLHGNYYTHVNWGGYLLWALRNEQKIFVDSRNLYLNAFDEWIYYERLEGRFQGPDSAAARGFDLLLDKYSVNFLVLPKVLGGRLSWKVNHLGGRRDWALVFDRDNTVVFVRRNN